MEKFLQENFVIAEQDIVEASTSTNDEQISDIENNSDDEESSPKRQKRIASKLVPHLKGLMGEANLRFARGDVETAKKMCFEIIRQAPESYEPYLTLAQMYENNNLKKYKAFLLLACHLQPSNSEIWCRLADSELQDNQIKAAINYYSKAIRAEPKNIDLHMKRMVLVEQKDKETNKRSMLQCKLMLAKVLPKSKHEQIINMCNEVSKEYFEKQSYNRAIEALRIPIKRLRDKVSQDLLNMMLELLILSERFSDCIDILTDFCGFTFDITVGENMELVINSFVMPDNLHDDLKTKFMVCLIKLQCYHLISPLIEEILQKDDIETSGILLFDVAEALMSSGYNYEAFKLLVPLVKSKNHSLAAVWLKYAECLSLFQMYDEAIDAYSNVIKMAPNHVDVLYPLAMLLIKQDKKERALKVLSQDIRSGKLHVGILIEQMKLLKQIGDLKDYWICCELFLSRHCIVFKNYEELKIAISISSTVREKVTKVSKYRIFRGQDIADLEFNLDATYEPSVDDEYEIYKDMLQFAYDSKAYGMYQKLAFMGLISKRFLKYFNEIYLIACFACLHNKDYIHGYTMAKELLIHHSDNYEIWNIYSLMLHMFDETRGYRFLDSSSMRKKLPAKVKDIIFGNYLNSAQNYALSYSCFLKRYKDSTYAKFMVALCVLQQYSQKNAISHGDRKSILETITYLFMNYANHRSKYANYEVFYNLGRMYQQVGIFHLAEYYYQKVLKEDNIFLQQYENILGLKQETAFNLHLIYKNSGNYVAAQKILFKHIVI